MTDACKESVARVAREFRLPRYQEIPTVGLYLEQTTKFIAEFLNPLQAGCITNSMISNYVKKHLISSPVKKQYDRDQIAYLIFIAVAKNVLSLDELARFIELQKKTYDLPRAYDYFCLEFENVLQYVFGLKPSLDNVGVDSTDEKLMLRNTISAVAYKIYMHKCLAALAAEQHL